MSQIATHAYAYGSDNKLFTPVRVFVAPIIHQPHHPECFYNTQHILAAWPHNSTVISMEGAWAKVLGLSPSTRRSMNKGRTNTWPPPYQIRVPPIINDPLSIGSQDHWLPSGVGVIYRAPCYPPQGYNVHPRLLPSGHDATKSTKGCTRAGADSVVGLGRRRQDGQPFAVTERSRDKHLKLQREALPRSAVAGELHQPGGPRWPDKRLRLPRR